MSDVCICTHPRADHQEPSLELGITAECDLCDVDDCPNFIPDDDPEWVRLMAEPIFPAQTCPRCREQHPGQSCPLHDAAQQLPLEEEE